MPEQAVVALTEVQHLLPAGLFERVPRIQTVLSRFYEGYVIGFYTCLQLILFLDLVYLLNERDLLILIFSNFGEKGILGFYLRLFLGNYLLLIGNFLRK